MSVTQSARWSVRRSATAFGLEVSAKVRRRQRRLESRSCGLTQATDSSGAQHYLESISAAVGLQVCSGSKTVALYSEYSLVRRAQFKASTVDSRNGQRLK